LKQKTAVSETKTKWSNTETQAREMAQWNLGFRFY